MAVIGIDLGTTNSIAVVFRNGEVEMIPNSFGEYLTPSVVTIENKELIVGKIAKQKLVTNPENTTSLFKRDMGTNKTIKLGKNKYLPQELSALVLKQLINDAEKYLNEKVEEVVISVPAYFNAKQRRATKLAGEIIGVKVDRLINEPSAAAIACHEEEFETFVVFDFGGGTLDVSVVDCFENVVSICSIAGNNQLGGIDFDKAIAMHFCQQNKIDYNSLLRAEKESLFLAAERVKIALQDNEEATMSLSIRGKLYSVKITNEILSLISKPILDEIREVIRRAVKDSGFVPSDIDRMIMVGGSSYMPIVRDYLEKLLKIPVESAEDIDYMVAMGLGKYLGIKQRCSEVKDLVVTDICPFSLSTPIVNESDSSKPLAKVIIPKNTVLPSSRTVTLQAYRRGQNNISISVYQGEEMYENDNILLGHTKVKIPRNYKENEQFNITYSYDINSMLYVEVEIISTGEKSVFIIGDDKKLESIKEGNQLNAIKEISIKLNSNPEYEACIERARRIYKELSPELKRMLQERMESLEIMYKDCVNNIQKKRAIVEEMERLLDVFDSISEFNESDIFSDFGIDDNSIEDKDIEEKDIKEKDIKIIDGTGGRLS
ncbi:Hsp70 family protein [Peptacetobacter hiranonis]|uniref:Chaperone protein DnaK n=1 Tax=Peptacetobacter hiranonis (strain DSM 13275 / JCM 10541 / KCTC 15199 / TO-931) TaxID=500633 RepID=B6G162_PEPHT|nr:Hsp70 family protein [Peptacetobacter hiranonis]EEA84468.1 DnaK family protein [Peptacetobacter hiranonis DSM 13275]QEK21546.1 Chaperone protein HscC [Peptacetobacter hiranonis]